MKETLTEKIEKEAEELEIQYNTDYSVECPTIKAFIGYHPEALAKEITDYIRENNISSYSIDDITYDKYLDPSTKEMIFIAYMTYQPDRELMEGHGDFDDCECCE